MSNQREFAATEIGRQRRDKTPGQREFERVQAQRDGTPAKDETPEQAHARRRRQLERLEREEASE